VHPVHLAVQLHDWIPNAQLTTVPRKMPNPTEHNVAVQNAAAALASHPRHEAAP
jgi:hypothetical protein